MTDNLVTKEKIGQEFLETIDIYFCEDCKVVQTQHDVEVYEYYNEYLYTVSMSPLAREFMKILAEIVYRKYNYRLDDTVIEIGSGDGFQLSCFKKLGVKVLGIEPSSVLVDISRENKIPVIHDLFNEKCINKIPKNILPAQIIVAEYTFDHLPDPIIFLENIKQILDPQRGLLVIEIHDLEKIIKRNETCLFEHEHSVYLTLLTIKRMLEKTGFKLLNSDLLPEGRRRSNSLLVCAALRSSFIIPDEIEENDVLNSMDKWETYVDFQESVNISLKKLKNYVLTQKDSGKRLAGFGAAGRGILTLAAAGLDNTTIDFLCDNNSSLWGLYTPGSHVPIVSPDFLRENPADELIIFSYGYIGEIQNQLSWYLNKGGQLTSILELL